MTTLSGNWTLTAIGKEAGWTQGVRVQGSVGQDGVHEMNLGDVLPQLRGEEITVTPYAFNPATQEWVESLERTLFSWDPVKGVVVTIYADDAPGLGDLDFNDLVVECVSDEREIRAPERRSLDLTIPEQVIGRPWPEAPWLR